MKITVINGSPGGNKSATLQYLNYIKNRLSSHDHIVLNIASKINKIRKDPEYFNMIVEEILSSDGIIWVFPVYVFLVPLCLPCTIPIEIIY